MCHLNGLKIILYSDISKIFFTLFLAYLIWEPQFGCGKSTEPITNIFNDRSICQCPFFFLLEKIIWITDGTGAPSIKALFDTCLKSISRNKLLFSFVSEINFTKKVISTPCNQSITLLYLPGILFWSWHELVRCDEPKILLYACLDQKPDVSAFDACTAPDVWHR